MIYPELVVRVLVDALNDDEEAFHYLSQSKYKEWAAFVDFLGSDHNEAFEFLLRNKEKFPLVFDFLAALNKQEGAFEKLMTLPEKQWAAVVNAVLKDSSAHDWLISNHYDVYCDLVDALYPYYNKSRIGRGIF